MDPRVSRFREHLRRLAANARPSYADCIERDRRRAETAREAPRRAVRWLVTAARAA
ncbi:MAG: hypothetical protein ACK52I_17920 [Pseudomonadota bacterium]